MVQSETRAREECGRPLMEGDGERVAEEPKRSNGRIDVDVDVEVRSTDCPTERDGVEYVCS